jgi:hypothetical protein
MTDRRLLHSRIGPAALETYEVELSSLQAVTLRKVAPWRTWAIGVLATCTGIGWTVSFYLRLVRMIELKLVALLTFAGILIMRGARPQWIVEWTVRAERHRLAQPFTWDGGMERELSRALQEIGRLLADPAARAARLAEIRVEMTNDTNLDERDRRLCNDGGCTGLIGDDGRCRVCGRA